MIPLPRLIDAQMKEVRRIHPIKVSIAESIVPLSTAQMILKPGDSIPYRSFVEMFTVNGSVGFYRAKTPSVGYGNFSNNVELEHAICEIGDYIIKGEIEQTSMTLEDALLEVFSHYNGNLWQIGDVDVEADVVISANYSNVLQTLNSLIALVPSAMMTFDFTTMPWTFNVVAKESIVSAEGRLSRNINNCIIQRNDNELCTRVWVKGLSEDPLESYMDGETIGIYGVIEKALDSSDYTEEQAILMAKSFLERYQYPSYSVTLNAVDLSNITGEPLDRMKIGKLYRLILPGEPNPIEETIIGLSWSDIYNQPNVVSVTLSEEEDQSTYTILSSQSTDINGNNGVKEKVNKDYSDIEAAIAKRYIIRTGIDINTGGVDIHGTDKYLKVRADSVVDVDLTDFKLDSANKSITAAEYHGGHARDASTETDFNNITVDGAYYVNTASMSNKPNNISSTDVELEVTSIGSSIVIQKIYIDATMYIRRRTSGTWGSWYKFTGTAS